VVATRTILQENKQAHRLIIKSHMLNGRMYGALEGLSRVDLAQRIGEAAVEEIRTSLSYRPPPMESSHPHWHKNEAGLFRMMNNHFKHTVSHALSYPPLSHALMCFSGNTPPCHQEPFPLPSLWRNQWTVQALSGSIRQFSSYIMLFVFHHS
jgi:hypothetical protein